MADYSDTRKAYGKYFLLLVGFSFIFLAICLLVAYFIPGATSLQGFAGFYMFGLILCFVFWNGHVGTEDNFLAGYVMGTISIFTVSFIMVGVSQQWGILNWSILRTEQLFSQTLQVTAQPLGLAFLSNISPQQALTVFMNIPGPIAEEACFRIFLWKLLSPAMGKWKALCAVAGSFGAVHFFAYGGDTWDVITAIIAGLGLGITYKRYESELAVCCAHLTFNLVVIMLRLLMVLPK